MSGFFGKQATGEVVSMERFRSGKSLSPIRQAEAYWSALRPGAGIGSGIPRRTQIDPRGLENILQFAFIVERIAPGIARFRLAGHHLNELAGMEVRGMPLTSFFTPAARTRISAVLEHMFDAPAVAELTLTSEARRRRPVCEARMILLPLENEAGQVTRALGVLIADEVPVDDAALRFDLGTTTLRPVSGVVPTPLPGILADKQPVDGFAEAQEPLTGPAPHLRLVK
jgi:hypothetical protein